MVLGLGFRVWVRIRIRVYGQFYVTLVLISLPGLS